VLEGTVRLMQTHGARAERIAAAIGPTIQQASYEVGPEFEVRLVEADPANARFFTSGRDDRALFDLPGFCASRLAALGLARIEALPLDTYASADTLFSYRRSVHAKEPDYGRNCSAISL
jgi:copper oxidase (laccase) domain-containing protein